MIVGLPSGNYHPHDARKCRHQQGPAFDLCIDHKGRNDKRPPQDHSKYDIDQCGKRKHTGSCKEKLVMGIKVKEDRKLRADDEGDMDKQEGPSQP